MVEEREPARLALHDFRHRPVADWALLVPVDIPRRVVEQANRIVGDDIREVGLQRPALGLDEATRQAEVHALQQVPAAFADDNDDVVAGEIETLANRIGFGAGLAERSHVVVGLGEEDGGWPLHQNTPPLGDERGPPRLS